MILTKINKAFILSFSHYRYVITILKSTKNHLTSQIISKSLIYALKTNDLIYQLFFKTFESFFKSLLNSFILISF